MNFLRPRPGPDDLNRTGRPRRNPLIWVIVIAAIVIYTQFEGNLFEPAEHATQPAVASGGIGGPFELVDHTGTPVTDQTYRGKFMLVYFGFTWCPDVCPTGLLVMAQAIDALGDEAEMVQPLFISVDPARDTVEKMAAYVPNFHERLIGLTGTEEQVQQAAQSYRVYFRKATEDENETDYLVDHSSYMYLMDPEGQFVQHYVHGQKPEAIAENIQKHL